MAILHIEHKVADYAGWKRNAFDTDPIGRAKSGVRRHRIAQSTDDPNYVFIELEFASVAEAEAMYSALKNLLRSPLAKMRIFETVEEKEY